MHDSNLLSGNSRGEKSKHPDEELPEQMKMIRNFYKPEMAKVYDLAHPNLDKSCFCKNAEKYRFSWLEKYVCEDLP